MNRSGSPPIREADGTKPRKTAERTQIVCDLRGLSSDSPRLHQKKPPLAVFSVIFACGELYCFAVIFGLRRVKLRFAQFEGEYNITLRQRRKISRLPQGKHFTSSASEIFHSKPERLNPSTASLAVNRSPTARGTQNPASARSRAISVRSPYAQPLKIRLRRLFEGSSCAVDINTKSTRKGCFSYWWRQGDSEPCVCAIASN